MPSACELAGAPPSYCMAYLTPNMANRTGLILYPSILQLLLIVNVRSKYERIPCRIGTNLSGLLHSMIPETLLWTTPTLMVRAILVLVLELLQWLAEHYNQAARTRTTQSRAIYPVVS